MARGRKAKTTGYGTSSAAQSRLSFNNSSARVTKPSTRADDASKRLESSKLRDSVQVHLEDENEDEVQEIEQPKTEIKVANVETTPEPETKEVDVAIRSSPRKGLSKPLRKTATTPVKDEREGQAEKITDAQIKKYWKAEEDSRLAPRGKPITRPFKYSSNHSPLTVHQSSLSLHEKILRHFDLSSQYGPCVGIPRLARWKRANMLGLEPPTEVLAVLLREENKRTSQGCGKIAYIDELAGGKALLVE